MRFVLLFVAMMSLTGCSHRVKAEIPTFSDIDSDCDVAEDFGVAPYDLTKPCGIRSTGKI